MKAILKYPGSKWNIAKWIIEHFPDNYPNLTYCEPFFGSGSIFFNKARSKIETINDLDSNVYNFFNIVRDQPEELAEALRYTPWSREEYYASYTTCDDGVEKARRFLVRMWQAFGAKSAERTGWRNNITAENRTVQGFHTTLPTNIIKVSDRLKHKGDRVVQIENQDVFKLLERYDREGVLIYLDPPYVRSTRTGRLYAHEFTNEDHARLLEMCVSSKAKIIISGYDCELYEQYLGNWNKDTITAVTESANKKTETLWMNYELQTKLF